MKNELFEYMEKIKMLFNANDYESVINYFKKIVDNSHFNSSYIVSLVAASYIKVNRPLEFIDAYKILPSNLKNNSFVLNNLCWCYYHGVIKAYDYKNVDEFERFLKIAEYIINNSYIEGGDNNFKTPYVLTVFKVVKVYKLKPSKNYREILRWLDKVDKEQLSDVCYEFVDVGGNNRELSSYKEKYYQYMSEAYEKTEDYVNCVKCCETAFKSDIKWHYRNGKWLCSRKLYCECIINNGDKKYLNKYRLFAYKENEWFMYSKLSDLYFRYNLPTDALIYGLKAILACKEKEMLVKVFMNVGMLLRNFGKKHDSKIFFQACAYYRYQNGWKFSEELEYILNVENIDYTLKPSFDYIVQYVKNYLKKEAPYVLEHSGIITDIIIEKSFGYIKCNNDKIYFNFRDLNFKNMKILEDDKVSFRIEIDDKNRKNAKNVRIIKNGSSN